MFGNNVKQTHHSRILWLFIAVEMVYLVSPARIRHGGEETPSQADHAPGERGALPGLAGLQPAKRGYQKGDRARGMKERRQKNVDMKSGIEEYPISNEKILLQTLIQRYRQIGKAGRPKRNASLPVSVAFGLGLISLDITEKENILSINTWTRYKWKDDYLVWDPEQYGGISTTRLSTALIWMPDIMLYNTASTKIHQREVLAAIKHDGTVTWYPHCTFHSTCSVDVRNYPYDNQTCHLWFGSWTHPMSELDINLSFEQGIDLSTWQADFKETSHWDVTHVEASKIVETGYAVLSFSLHLKRRVTFTAYILTIPVVLLSLLTLMVFWLPASGADKGNLGLAIFGSLLLLLLILVEASPSTASAVPMLGVYYCFNLVLVLASIFLSTWICSIGTRKAGQQTWPVPPCLLKAMRCLTPVLRLRPPPIRKSTAEKASYRGPQSRYIRVSKFLEPAIVPPNGTVPLGQAPHSSTHNCPLLETVGPIIYDLLAEFRDKNRHEKDSEKLDQEWACVADFVDRILLVMFASAVVASLIFIYPKS